MKLRNSVKKIFLMSSALFLAVGLFYIPQISVVQAEEEEIPEIAAPFEGFEPRYEAEDAVITRAKVGDYGNAHSGTGFVGEIDYNDSHIMFTVEVDSDGEYDLLLAYAIGEGFNAATLHIHNDAGYYTQVSCTKMYGWGEFRRDAVVYGKISLRAGEDHVTVYKGTNYAQVDFIGIGARTGDYIERVSGSEVELPAGYTRYEAETGYVVNASAKGGDYFLDYGSGYSGGGFVGNLDSAAHYVDIPVKVNEDGAYDLNVRYASGSLVTPILKISVLSYGPNGYQMRYGTVSCSVRNGWGEFSLLGVANLRIALRAGESYVRISPEFDYAEVDCIEVSGKVGDYFEGVDERIELNGDNTFDSDFFADEKDDGYIAPEGEKVSVLFPVLLSVGGVLVLAAAAVLIVMIIKKRRKNS